MNDGLTTGLVDYRKVRVTQKVWGYEREFVNTPLYCGKELFILNGCSCSFHYHRLKSESFLVKNGYPTIKSFLPNLNGTKEWWWDNMAKMDEFVMASWVKEWYFNAQQSRLKPGDVFNIPAGVIHQIQAGVADCSIIEFSTHHEDSDVFRLLPGHGL